MAGRPSVGSVISVRSQGAVRSPTSFQAVNRVFISCRCWAAVSRWRRARKCGDIPLNAERNRCALPGERNLFIARSAAWSAGGSSRLGCSDSTVSGLPSGIRSGSRTRTSWTSPRRQPAPYLRQRAALLPRLTASPPRRPDRHRDAHAPPIRPAARHRRCPVATELPPARPRIFTRHLLTTPGQADQSTAEHPTVVG